MRDEKGEMDNVSIWKRKALFPPVCGAILAFALIACSSTPQETSKGPAAVSAAEKAAWSQINQDRLLARIKVLSSDEFEGRAPASEGETRTISFVEKEFKDAGLEPGNPDGTYVQKVPLIGITPDPNMQLTFTDTISKKQRTLNYGSDFMAWTKREAPSVSMNSDMIFVGYGVVAPEFNWDDYKGVDVSGKVLVMLVNDPPVPDEKVFGGKAMTYYGRWTYKFEIAAQKHAAGCLVIHETGPAGYPWAVVEGSNRGEQFDLLHKDKGMSRAAVEGWITFDQAQALFEMAGKDLLALKKAAAESSFTPVPLGVSASLTIHNKMRTIESNNVIGKLQGSDPKLRDECVVYMAHWDHLGMDNGLKGDKIYNGAKDNASGSSGLMELADAYAKVQPPPRRSILFLSVTAEEQGLLGSQYYAEHPLYPLAKTAAAINMDALNVLGRTKDIVEIGLGNSSLDDYVKQVAAEQGRVVKPDQEPEKGYYYRSDHFNFAKQGVPALDPDEGTEFIGKPEGWGIEMRKKYTEEDYHKPSDEVKPYWDLSGMVEDLQLLFSVGYRVANANQMPTWSPGTEFKAKREAMLKAAMEDSSK
jgi:Zn-dependent M28 family amino/carboxypeptidase